MESTVGLIDSYEFLSQDQCEHPVVTHGHVWSNKIQVWIYPEAGWPAAPTDKPVLDRAVVAAKLDAVRKTTVLGTHTVPGLNAKGPRTVVVPNAWAVVYGRVVPVPNLNQDCGVKGCGGMNVPLVVLAEPDQVRRLAIDGSQLPPDR
jgi:hypothetical protein